MKNISKLILSIVICQLAGLIGSLATAPAISTWYSTIRKPSFNPPNWVFAPVWITLFFLMGISLYLVWSKGFRTKRVKKALLLFGVQLVLNMFWSFLFFGLRLPVLAFMEIVLLWLAILLTILSFYKISKPASFLLLPYLLWVTFASVLNLFIYKLNMGTP